MTPKMKAEIKRIKTASTQYLLSEFKALLDVIELGVPINEGIKKRVPEMRRRIEQLEKIITT